MHKNLTALAFLFFLLSFIVRIPTIREGLPYFYNEDEAHHFNRVVNMTKSGDFNPHYFNKPSLHFYLRIPVTAAAFLWSVKEGEIRSIKEVITSDPEGVANYAFSVSHKRLLTWNRTLSVLFSSGMIFFLFLLLFEITYSKKIAAVGALMAALCPELIRYSGTVGVDCVMGFFAVLSVYLSVLSYRRCSTKFLYWGAICAGLAVSSKYNALPIIVTPLLPALFDKEDRIKSSAIVLLLCAFGFIAGSPYILKEFPLFLDHFAYEIWHYKIEGHVGHTAEPGFAQALFYFNWISSDAVGFIAAVLGFVGLIIAPKYGRSGIIYLSFPALFFLLMISQKANFTRNMVPFLPFFCGGIAISLSPLLNRKRYIAIAVTAVLLIMPLLKTKELYASFKGIEESRERFVQFLEKNKLSDVAVDATLQFPRKTVGIEPVKDYSPINLWMNGFSKVALGPGIPFNGTLENKFPGDPTKIWEGNVRKVRAVANPEITLYSVPTEYTPEDLRSYVSSQGQKLQFHPEDKGFTCKEKSEEPYCWIRSRYAKVSFSDLLSQPNFSGRDGVIRMSLTVLSPWKGLKPRITFDDFLAYMDIPPIEEANKWQEIVVDFPYSELKEYQYFIINIDTVHSLKNLGVNQDPRRLGLAIKEIKIIPR